MEWLPVHKRVPRHDFVTFFPHEPGEKPRVLEDQAEAVEELPVADDDEMQDEMA